MNIVIFDDDMFFIGIIKKSLNELNKKYSGIFTVFTYSTVAEIMAYVDVNRDNVSLYILDIMIDDVQVGFSIAEHVKKVNEDNSVIYVTHCKEQILASSAEHKMYAMLFIYKESDCFLNELEYALLNTYDFLEGTYLIVDCYPKIFKVKYDDILYFKKEKQDKNKVNVVYKNGTVVIKGRLKSLMKELHGNFCYAIQDIIVNTQLIIGIDKKERILIFENGMQCPYTRRRQEELINKCRLRLR